MEDYQILFTDYLKTRGLKFTPQRQQILDYIFEIHSHFNVEKLITDIQLKYKDVSRATVYRTIPLLLEAGLIKFSTKFDAKDCYEHVFGHPKHFHLLCQKCGRIIEVDETPELIELIHQFTNQNNFILADYQLIIQGLCHDCRK